MYYELGYFWLITGETCQHECEKLINCVKENKPILTAKMAKEPFNPNNLVSRAILEENRWITSRALKARFWPRKSSL